MSSFLPTSEQLEVIEYDCTKPLRVAAGAGTGKTTTIVHRVKHAINAGVDPEQVLGLTFTNKAIGELRARLDQVLPNLVAESRQVHVTTYHGFAYELVAEFGAYVGVERNTRLITPGYLRELISQQLAAADPCPHLDMTAPSNRIGEVASLMREMADNLTDARTVRDLVTNQDPTSEARHELLDIAERTATEKRKLGLIDYSDLIANSVALVTNHPTIKARVRDRYRLLILDEYQDTGPAQRELLRAIFGNGFSVTAVGDSNQTIYEWRGASIQNFRDFPIHFCEADSPAKTLQLSTNRRSAVEILQLANQVSELLDSSEVGRLLPDTATTVTGSVHAALFHSAADEAVGIAQQIRQLVDEQGVDWRDIAVLFRKNAQIPLIRDALDAYDIPFEVASLGGLLSVPEVADLRAWLSILEDPADAPSTLRILLGGATRLGLGDIAKLRRWISSQAGISCLVETFDYLDQIPTLDISTVHKLQAVAATYRKLLVDAQGLSLVELARRVLEQTAAWAEIDALPPNPSLTARLNLYRFLDLTEEWSPLQGRPSLGSFLGHLDVLEEDTASQELDTAGIGNENAVTLLTIHRAKGLEWEVVFMPAAAEGILPSRMQSADNPTRRAGILPYEARLDKESLPQLTGAERSDKDLLRERHSQQELRTAYVAVTRAKRLLFISAAHWYSAGRPRKPGVILQTALAAPKTIVGTMIPEPGDEAGRLQIESPVGAPDPVFSEGWQQALRESADDQSLPRAIADSKQAYDAIVKQTEFMLDSLPAPSPSKGESKLARTSVTGLVTVTGCPRRFFWSEVDPLPRRQSRAMRRGVEVHRLIEMHVLGHIPLWETTDDLYDSVGSPSDRATPYQNFRRSRFWGHPAAFVEVPIEIARPAGRIRGRIDAVYEKTKGEWEVVDWKSGTASTDPANLVQLQAYAVAAMEGLIGNRIPRTLTVSFCYLGGTRAEVVTHEVTEQWLLAANDAIDSALRSASGPEYLTNPGERCRSCDYSRFCDDGQAWLAGKG